LVSQYVKVEEICIKDWNRFNSADSQKDGAAECEYLNLAEIASGEKSRIFTI